MIASIVVRSVDLEMDLERSAILHSIDRFGTLPFDGRSEVPLGALGGALIGTWQEVAVNIKRECGRGVSEPLLDGLHRHAVLKRLGCVAVPEVVEAGGET